MFLFKKRKDGSDEKTALEKTEEAIKSVKENNKLKSKPGSDPVEPQDSSMKVVIPASSLLEDEDVISIKEPEVGKSGISEEDIDKMLVAVNQNKPEIEIPDISLDVLKPEQEKVEKNKPVSNKTEIKAEQKQETIPETKPEVKAEAVHKIETKLEAKPEIKPDIKPEIKTEVKPENKIEAKTEIKTENKSETKSGAKVETKTDVKAENKGEAKPAAGEGEKGKKGGGEEKENLFSNLFTSVEVEEDNPLKRLINSLPEISIDEVMNEADEVKGLMSEWYVNQGKNVIK
jgi:hypothetical protein